MSLKMIKPLDITDSNMTSSIAEPDLSQGEIEWVNPDVLGGFENAFRKVFATEMYNNKIYCLSNSRDVAVLDVADDSIAVYENLLPSATALECSAITSDGVIYTHSGEGEDIFKLDTSTMTASAIGVGVQACYAGKIATDGKIYFVGSTDDLVNPGKVVRIDPDDDEITFLPGGYTPRYFACELANNGAIYCIGASGKVLKINVDTQTSEEFGSHTWQYNAMSKGSDGHMYCAGNSGQILKIDTNSDSLSVFGSIMEYYNGSCAGFGDEILMSGRIFEDGALKIPIVSLDVTTQSIRKIYSDQFNFGRINTMTYSSYNNLAYGIGEDYIAKVNPPSAAGDNVTISSTHKKYEAVANTRINPIAGVDLTPPAWIEVSATNKYKAFDYAISTKSIMSASTAKLTFTPDQAATNIALFGLEDVTRVYVKVYENNESGALIYSEYKDLAIASPIEDVLVNDELLGSKVIFDDLPLYSNPHIVVTFDPTGGEIKVGDVVIGNARTLGVTLYQSSTSRTSYDTVETDVFGNDKVTSRPSAEYTSYEVTIYPKYADYVERILKDSLNKPRVWVGTRPDNDKLFTFGYYERSPITYSSPSKYDTTLKVRGLV